MPDDRGPLRVLQLIGDTDAIDGHVAAVGLHRQLTGIRFEVRTLALTPGRRGGLERDVPAIAPGKRSFAARGVVAQESRWADVLVLHAPRALTIATSPPRRAAGPPVVVAYWHDVDTRPARGAEVRCTAGAARVVAPSESVRHDLSLRLGRSVDIEVVPADLSAAGRPVLDVPRWADLLGDVVPTWG